MALQKTETTPTWQESYDAVYKQMKEHKVMSKKFTPEEMDIMVRSSLVAKALDKVAFSVSGARRRGAYRKYVRQMSLIGEPNPMDEEEYYTYLEKRTRSSLAKQGYSFALTKAEKESHEVIVEGNKKKAIEETTKYTAEALKKILTSM